MKKLLYLTDLNYPAQGRSYGAEDMFLTGVLKDVFDVALCHPKNAEAFEDAADLIVFRNTGSVLGYQAIYDDFLRRVQKKGLRTFNEFCGKADMRGKQYLLDLTAAGYPVIPTVDTIDLLDRLPACEAYVTKPKNGADSIGLQFVDRAALFSRPPVPGQTLIQPAVDFEYEVSFYFINDKLEYALYAPDRATRWKLVPYAATDADKAFAQSFIRWNSIRKGIQRVDACRTRDGKLLLVELEDLNPYLSIAQVDEATRRQFLDDLIAALRDA